MRYTAKEIQINIERLDNRLEILQRERTVLSQDINSIKKQITDWQDLDSSQSKLF